MSLRKRLLIAILGLLAAVSLIVGVVSVATLQSSLMTRLDAQLTAATNRTAGVVDGGEGSPEFPNPGTGKPAPDNFLGRAGLPPRTIGGFVRNGTLDVRLLGTNLETTELTEGQLGLILALPADGSPRTVDLGGDLGEYRISIVTDDDGRGGLMIGMPMSDVHGTMLQLILVISLVSLAGLIAAFLAGLAIVRLALRPLDRVAETATRVSELPLDRGEVALAVRVADEDADPTTEVGKVGAALNRMLGHVASALSAREASERKVRTFVADASHELRTPLASIRGYAELTRRGGHELPADVVHALSRVESESIRMTGLVDDLLLLARLDDGRSLESHPVDLTAMLADAVSDAHAVGQEHKWLLDVPKQPVTVPGDAVRLHQVVANLLTNARVHTPAGTRVIASLEPVDGAAIIRVTDDGPGIDEKVRDQVFERFVRGDNSRSRAAGSTGLGLAIVAAIVEAHGGTVGVESAPGRTTFTVDLPRGPVIA